MLQVERTYSASAKLISAVDDMLEQPACGCGASVMMSTNYISTLHALVGIEVFGHDQPESRSAMPPRKRPPAGFADVGLQLGISTGRDVALRADMGFIDQIVDTNGLVTGRLDVTQNRITQLGSTAQDFLKNLIAARDADSGARMILPSAAAGLQDVIGALNASYNGSYLFGGHQHPDRCRLRTYTAGSTSKNRGRRRLPRRAFGFSQSAAGVSTITPAQMQSFLNTSFDAEFASPAWNANWSQATNQALNSRISTTEVVDTSVSANEPGFRKLAEAYTMLSDLGNIGLSQATFQDGRRQGDQPRQRRDQRSRRARRLRRRDPAARHRLRPTS